MVNQMKLFLFGDQTFDTQSSLKDLDQHRYNPVLESFLSGAYGALRKEIYSLSEAVRNDLPRFTCIEDIILRKPGGRKCTPLDMAVTCLYQLATFISQVDSQDYASQNVRVLGLCTGALAAAAVSCSKTTLDLIPSAIDAVVVAFRLGLQVEEVAQRVEPSEHSPAAWSIVVPGVEAGEAAVRKFCEQTILPRTSRPYISAYAPNGVTISGPPRSLAQLISSASFKELRHQKLNIYAPFHAPHLYSQHVVDEIVGGAIRASAIDRPSQIPLLSSTGDTVTSGTLGKHFTAAVAQVLLAPIRWSAILQDLQVALEDSGVTSFTITPIATKADQLIFTALKQTTSKHLLQPHIAPPTQTSSIDTPSNNYSRAKIAIIGMSGRFPSAKNNEAFWDVLYQGLDVHKPVPAQHWDAKTHVDPTGTKKNTSATPYGCWLDDPAEFDARFFNISPREAPQIDPAQRLALMTAYEAIEEAGIVADATPSTRRDRVGVFYGVTSNDWMETNSAQAIDTYFIPGGNRAFIPGRINYCFKFSGPSYAVDTACSSSLAGIHLACNALWRGDIDTAIAGGTNVLTNPDFTAGLDRGHFLSRTGNCKTFDDGADGYCRGEGIGTVILKRLDDAIADNDPILATVLGAYTNHSAESESITRPHVGAQREIFSKILNQASVDPYTVSYVEMHGTGTQAGDAGEMSSVLSPFAPPLTEVTRARSEAEALYLGSAKANIGHGEAASGVTALVKVLMMMQKNTIVPHCGIKTKINHKFPTDLAERNVNIALKPTSWERSSDPARPRRVFVNNFSAAGGNSALLLEDAPLKRALPANVGPDSRSLHVVTASAKNGISLQGNLKSLLKYLKDNPETSLGKLSYTTTARRQHHQHRVLLTGGSTDDICNQIEAALRNEDGMKRPKSAPKVVFTFTGQGAQYPGMGKGLFESFSTFRTEMESLDQLAQGLGFPSVLPFIHSDEIDANVFAPIIVQLASICMQLAMAKLWASWGILPTAVVGHSLGEYAALAVAGVLSDADALYLVGKRAELLMEKCTRETHSMLVVRGSEEDISRALGNISFEIACLNSPTETVLAGPNEEIAAVKEHLTNANFKSTLMKVPYAFHSSQVEPILDDFQKAASGVTFSQSKIPVLCPLDGSIVHGQNNFSAQYLADHARQPVNMHKALLEGRRTGVLSESHSTLELGPHPAVSGMVRGVFGPQAISLASCQRGRPAFPILATALKSLYTGGAPICWSAYHADFKASHEVLSLPAYSWDLKEYWMQYVNDWSLRKGDPPLLINNANASIESTTIHQIVEESERALIVEADIARKDLSPLVQGHEVDGIPLCTPSVYCDMALTMGDYLMKKHRPGFQDHLVDVSDMTISKALILKSGVDRQPIQAHGDIDWSNNAALIRFMSFDSKQKLQEHARCTIRLKDRSFLKKLQQEMSSTKQKMQELRKGIAEERTARFNRPMVYRAIRPLARFHDDYRAIDEVVLDSNTLEASSAISFGTVKRGGTYHTHPAIIDSLTQSCGFTMNCNDGVDLDKEVFMNHGWSNFQIYQPLDFDKSYTTYTRMSEGEDKLWHGDVTVYDGDEIVAWFGKIAIQGVPRRVLQVILNIEAGGKKATPAPASRAAPAPKAAAPVSVPSKPQQAAMPVSAPAQSSGKGAKAIAIIAEESGLDMSDLTENTVFADVGIDSLLGLTICARFKEELDVDLDFAALTSDVPSVADLKTFLGESGASTATTASLANSLDSTPAHSTSATGATTPASVQEDFTSDVDFKKVLAIISEESGVGVDELTDETDFADSGIDSLLSLVIVSRLRDEMELDIQQEALFSDCPTVADLRAELCGSAPPAQPAAPHASAAPAPAPVKEVPGLTKEQEHERQTQNAARKAAVDSFVEKYTAGFRIPPPAPANFAITDSSKVVMVTGASGSLGSHLVDQLAQMDEIKTVVCLNREKHNVEPYTRQQKAMREKGRRSFDKIRPKLLVLQTDSAKPKLGLIDSEYEKLVTSVTHIIHQAWPMSAKRPLSGFESQFQVMRNLVDLACDASSRRPESFEFSFQLVSSIGVVGQYGTTPGVPGTHWPRITVPEERMDIETILPNGYGEAKWGCERMLDETLHRDAARFRPMVVRLGQIAGCKEKGYWNPMEHFGFLIKSSQTLGALPDVPGDVFWTPVNDIAGTLNDLVLREGKPHAIYHIENPVGQTWKEMNGWLADAMGIKKMMPFEEWVEMVKKAPQRGNPASQLLEFLDSNYMRMSCGGLILGTKNTLEHSPTLRGVGPVSEEVARKYIHIWKEIGFLA